MYFFLTLPITALFLYDVHFRQHLFNYCIRQSNKIRPPKYVFVGDSITAGGLNWGWRLDRNLVAATSFGLHGYQANQLVGSVKSGTALRPKFFHLLVGTNDALAQKPVAEFSRDFRTLVELVAKSNATLVVTLVPYQGDAAQTELIQSHNAEIATLQYEFNFRTVDLNPVIAPEGVLLPQYSDDGIHFTPDAYNVWIERLKPVMDAAMIDRSSPDMNGFAKSVRYHFPEKSVGKMDVIFL
ncbi:MAG: SGNH/GDSL hydrolase family protein [Rhodopirellula sp. JB044]|uniref:SGNH/GDSL hydrolase family protein n=1 Tax=Rhodopirellula sp. JB044 TaxID=3342844 RepID=UPI00370CB736